MCDLDRSMDPADEMICDEPYFQWERWLALCATWHLEAAGMFALSSYVPPSQRCFRYDSRTRKYDVSRLDQNWARRFATRIRALITIGVRPIVHALEFCGSSRKWGQHPWDPKNNINGVGYPEYYRTMGIEGIDTHQEFFKMLWNALKPVDRKEVIWTTGNEPPPYAVPQQIAFAQWLRTQGVAYDHLWSVVSEHIVNEFDASKPWKKSVNAIVAHGMASVKDIDDAMKTTYLGVNKSIIPHTDGGVQMMSLKPATLRAMLRRYPSTSVMWNLPEGFDRTKQAAWDAVWKHTGALMKVMAEV